MCDHEHYDDLKGRVIAVEGRVSSLERELGVMREENKSGFADLKTELQNLYAERKAWSDWLRENLGRVLKWAGIIILVACGITQMSSIGKMIVSLQS